MLHGMMMNRPLLISSIIDFAAEIHPKGEVVSATIEGPLHRYEYPAVRGRVIQLAHALVEMGVKPGDRIATLAWNGHRHLELYYAVSSIGAVCHTINPRLFPEQLIYITNHADDKFFFFDINLAPLVAKLRGHFPKTMGIVAMTDQAHAPAPAAGLEGMLVYEELLAGKPETIVWPEFDENTAATLCYTSGTTAEPKGALYSHRSQVLHALFMLANSTGAFETSDRKVLPVVPLFHVNAWGLPFAAPLRGTTMVMPGVRLDGPNLFDLLDSEDVYSSWGVPTVWLGLLAEMKKRGRKPKGLMEVGIGGSAAPTTMIREFEGQYGIAVMHGWGMTEMSPVGTLGTLEPHQNRLPLEERVRLKELQGRRMFGVDLKIVGEDGRRLPHDGVATGELFVRGNAVISGYYNNDAANKVAFDAEGWFGTGDVAAIAPDGFLNIVDRAKDLIKSGGEWISSIDIENEALAVPGVANCAVIGIPHPKWDERPILVAVKSAGADPTKEAIMAHLATKVARWQLPDDVVFVEALPMTATGKVSKRNLRQQFGDYHLPDVAVRNA
jgi:3-(methylthio)propionyl---CoA ligase